MWNLHECDYDKDSPNQKPLVVGIESNQEPSLPDHTVPMLAAGLRSDRVTGISCGGTACAGNKFYLACTASGAVYSWGDDNEFGKLGRGGGASLKTPQIVDRLQSVKAVKVIDTLSSCSIVTW